MRLDPVTLEILATKAASVTEEMGLALQRSGRTIYVKETEDFGTALVNINGKTFAYPKGDLGVTNMIDNDASQTIAAVPGLEPGDIIITNHPYTSHGLASHLPDIHLLQPYFHEGEIVCFGWTFIHSADVGGRVPSSISPSNHDIYQEGLMIPPLKLVRGGTFNSDVVAFIAANCRTAEENLGDLRAMVAALGVGARRIAGMIGQHGTAACRAATTELIAYSAAKARDAFRTLPNGTYEFTDYLDDDYNTPLPVRIQAKLTVDDGLLHLDFSGTSPQVASAYNLPSAGGRHTWLSIRLLHYALTRDPTIPINSGIFEPVTMTVPKGSVLNPVFPAAVGVRHATGNRVCDVVSGLLCQAVPDFMSAAGCGLLVPIVLAEPPDAADQRKIDVIEPLTGGTGASKGFDGVDARETSVSGMSNNPIEAVEASASVRIIRYGIRMDSGGPGQWRGGAGFELTFTPTRDRCQVLGRGVERFRFAPWGLAGGRCAERARIVLNLGLPDERELGKIDIVDVRLGETVTILTPGGGGYGNPLDRDPNLVCADVRREVVSPQRALADYGVVLHDGVIDIESTELERRRRKLERARQPDAGMFDFGPQRSIWDSAFGKDFICIEIEALGSLPASMRSHARYQCYAPLIAIAQRGKEFDNRSLADVGPQVRAALEALKYRRTDGPPRDVSGKR